MRFSLETKDNSGSILLYTAYLPSVTYVAKCMHADKVIIEQFETYPKQTLRNRCFIFGPNGLQLLSVPVTRPHGNHTKTKDIRISYDQQWQRHHLRSINTAYNNSPFFLYYQDHFLPVFEKRFDFLIDLNCALLEKVFRILKSGAKVILTEQFYQAENSIENNQHSEKKPSLQNTRVPEYTQVFSPKHGFLPDLSIIDLIFNLGPEAATYLQKTKETHLG